jgi:hypothetical protein
MKVSVWQRHYVNGEGTMQTFKDIAQRSINAAEKRPQISQTVFVQYPKKLGIEKRQEIMNDVRKLVEKKVSVYSSVGHGVGYAWFTSMFNYLGEKAAYREEVNESPRGFVKTLIDADQYNVDDDAVLDGIEKLAEMLVAGKNLIGLSARDRVILGDTKMVDDSRKIEEMYHAKAIGKIKISNPVKIKIIDVPKAYQRHGDPIPGLYQVNIDHKSFQNFMNDCSVAAMKANLNGFAGDPYAVMRASTYVNQIPSIYIPIKENKASSFNLDDIKNKSVELGKTDIGNSYLESVRDDQDFRKELAEEFTKETIDDVRNMILEGLKQTV